MKKVSENSIIERKFRSDSSMEKYINNKWMINQLKKKYDPTIYTAWVDKPSRRLIIDKR